MLGAYFRSYLLHEGLLTGNDRMDAARSYFRANSIQRSNATAHAFRTGLIPRYKAPVHSYPLGQADAVFDPITAKVVTVDTDRAATEAQGIFNSGTALISSYSAEYSLLRSVLFNYQQGTDPPPSTPSGLIDTTALAIPLTADTTELATGNVINVGGLMLANMAADPFVMQYAEGFSMDQVAWGRLTLDEISQLTLLVNNLFQIELLSPYLNKLQSSNAASHVLRTMEQAITGKSVPGAFGDARSRIVVVISSDGYVAGLAGLLQLHWLLSGYQQDFCAPGGALVFELRQSKSSKEYLVRVFYTAQTFDQLRNLTSLTLDQPPATMQLLVPGGSKSATDLAVNFDTFKNLINDAIDQQYVQDPSKEVPPGILNGVDMD